jgi:hypothetical protein
MPITPTSPAKNAEGDFEQFTDFMRQLVAVPHDTIMARIKTEKESKRTAKASASLDPDASHTARAVS